MIYYWVQDSLLWHITECRMASCNILLSAGLPHVIYYWVQDSLMYYITEGRIVSCNILLSAGLPPACNCGIVQRNRCRRVALAPDRDSQIATKCSGRWVTSGRMGVGRRVDCLHNGVVDCKNFLNLVYITLKWYTVLYNWIGESDSEQIGREQGYIELICEKFNHIIMA